MTQRSSVYVSWTPRLLPDGGGDDTIVTAVPSSTEKVSGPRTQFGSVRPLEHLQTLADIHSAKSRFAHTCAHGFQVTNDHFEPGEKQAHFNRPEAAGRKMLSGQTLARRSRSGAIAVSAQRRTRRRRQQQSSKPYGQKVVLFVG